MIEKHRPLRHGEVRSRKGTPDPRVWADRDWYLKNFDKLAARYRGKLVAVRNRRVVPLTSKNWREEARRKLGGDASMVHYFCTYDLWTGVLLRDYHEDRAPVSRRSTRQARPTRP